MSSPGKPRYKRILLKISGEALMGDQSYGIHPEVLNHVAKAIADVAKVGVEVAVVVGAGNIFRGAQAASASR